MVCGSPCGGTEGRGGLARSGVGRPAEVPSSGLRDLERPRRTLRFCAKVGGRARRGSKPLPSLWFLPQAWGPCMRPLTRGPPSGGRAQGHIPTVQKVRRAWQVEAAPGRSQVGDHPLEPCCPSSQTWSPECQGPRRQALWFCPARGGAVGWPQPQFPCPGPAAPLLPLLTSPVGHLAYPSCLTSRCS